MLQSMVNNRKMSNKIKSNMRILSLVCVLLLVVVSAQAQITKEFPLSVTVKVVNPLSTVRNDVLLNIPQKDLPKGFNANAFVVMDGETEIASQYNKADADYSGIVLVLDQLKANETKNLTVRYARSGTKKRTYTKRTQAELSHKVGGEWKNREYIGGDFKNVNYLRVPPEHKDHSWYLRYEGPGWESDKVGYRLYLDQRNAVDVFGKVVAEPSLQKAGLDGFDSYHNMQPWGMDVLKVGKSLGIGSIGYLTDKGAIRVELTDSVNCRITENGDVYSSFLTNYYGWNIGQSKVDLASRISIHAGTRLTHTRLTAKGTIDNISTGLIKDDKTNPKLFTSNGDKNHFGYIATYGAQSLNNFDNLGIVVFFDAARLQQITEDQFSHIVKLSPVNGSVDYYYAGVWEKEKNGITNEADFITYVKQVAAELANPIKIQVIKK